MQVVIHSWVNPWGSVSAVIQALLERLLKADVPPDYGVCLASFTPHRMPCSVHRDQLSQMLGGHLPLSQVRGLGCNQQAMPWLWCVRVSVSLPNTGSRTLAEGGERPCLRAFLHWAQKGHVWREQPAMGCHLLLRFSGSRCCLAGSAGRDRCCQNPSLCSPFPSFQTSSPCACAAVPRDNRANAASVRADTGLLSSAWKLHFWALHWCFYFHNHLSFAAVFTYSSRRPLPWDNAQSHWHYPSHSGNTGSLPALRSWVADPWLGGAAAKQISPLLLQSLSIHQFAILIWKITLVISKHWKLKFSLLWVWLDFEVGEIVGKNSLKKTQRDLICLYSKKIVL